MGPQRQTSDGPDGVLVHLLRLWAREYARIVRGGIRFADGTWHEDGWPRASISGKLKDAEQGETYTARRQNFAEVYSEDALLVRLAMVGMRPYLLEIIQWHYLVKPPAHRRAQALGISTKRYYELVAIAHGYLQGRIDGDQNDRSGPR
jgi:hypothetical protein